MTHHRIQLKGHVTERIWQNGKLVAEHKSCNLILNNAGTLLASLLATANSAHTVTHVGFGEGNAAPQPEDTSLTDPVNITVQGYDLATPGQVTFTYLLDYNTGNGKTITERALQTAGGTLFSRIVRPAIEKTADLAIEGEWTIEITGA